MSTVETVRTLQGDTLAQVVWRYYGATSGYTEAVLAENPGIAAIGEILPMGTLVRLPLRAAIDLPSTGPTLTRLWD